uniref:WS_DGAT_C domain-containing protein n=1 Tax=Angiostrongylus cantonensis TaxID=6313 RepID=A0A0K0DJK2_ANGCA
MSPSGGDPYRSPPIIRKRTAFPLTITFRKLFGLLITILTMFILVAGIPVYLILSVIGFFKKKSKRWSYEQRCCTHQWPISGTGPDLAGMIFTGTVDLETINKEAGFVAIFSFVTLKCVPFNSGRRAVGVTTPTKRATCRPDVCFVSTWVRTLSQRFGDIYAAVDVNGCRLPVCMHTTTTVYVGSHTPVNGLQQHVFGRFPQTAICMSCRFALCGPSSLLVLALRGQNSVWKYLQHKDCVPNRNRRRLRVLEHRSSSSMLMNSVPDDTNSDTKSPTHVLHQSSSLHRNVVRPAVHRRSWMTVEHPELLFRAEKLLRANTCELLLSLVAGALRNYFRGQGILHPPDLGCVIPFSARGLTAIGDCCETNLLPLELPTSVEGAIPRLWAVQKRVAKAVRGPMSGAIAVARGLGTSNYSVIDRIQISSDAHLRTTFAFPSLIASMRAAFVFVQHGNIIDMSVSLCSNTFPDLERVLYSFQRETRLLLDHLSLRLLSLPQITVLPGVTACLGRERTENESNDESFIHDHTNREFIDDHVDEYSLEELYRLLDIVQRDLDSMRSNPESNRRGHYIQRLTSLEEKMQKFHECISQKLSTETVGLASGDDEVGDAIANVLAPYRDEPGQPSFLDCF